MKYLAIFAALGLASLAYAIWARRYVHKETTIDPDSEQPPEDRYD